MKNSSKGKSIKIPRGLSFLIILVLIFSALGEQCFSQQIAFPGAEGYGKYTTGGRGGKVIEVTNLNSSGPGSFAAAVAESGARTVVFRVGGTIDANIDINNGDITIAGQTAPGEGILLKGELGIGADNVIIRYIRVRTDKSGDAMGGRYNDNIIIDHVSTSWSTDETMSIYHGNNVTIQWCMITEAMGGGHAFGGIWGNNHSTYHHNLFAHNVQRNPRIASGAGYNDFRNNVIYNWESHSLYGGEQHQGSDSRFQFCSTNVVANYLKPGPGTNAVDAVKICSPWSRDRNGGDADWGKWYVADNYMHGNEAITNDNWEGVIPVRWTSSNQEEWQLDKRPLLKLDAPSEFMPINQQSAEDAYQAVLEHAGCSLPIRDAIDTRIIEEVRNGTATYGNGFVGSPSTVGGWPTLSTGPVPEDSDHDGMPDTWEDENGLNKNDPEDRNGIGAGGYTNLENYINSITTFTEFLPVPIGFTGKLEDFTNVELSWDDVTEDETGLRLERAETDTGSFAVIAELDADVTSYLDASLKELTLYRYRLMAFNDSLQSGYTTTIEILTLSPTALPTAVSDPSPENDAKYIDTAPTLTWEPSLNADSYDVYFGIDNPPPFVSNQVKLTFEPGDLDNAKKYYWRIDGKNSNGTTEGSVWNFTVKPDIEKGQLAYWKLDETSGTIAADEEKYGLNGELMNMEASAWTDGFAGGGLNFDGSDDYVLIPHNSILDFSDQSFSISVFAKVTSFPAGSMYLINKGSFSPDDSPGATGTWYGIEIKNGELRFAIDDNTSKSQATYGGAQSVLANKWVHIVAVRDRAEGIIKLYVNGQKRAEANDATGSLSQDIDLRLGGSTRGSGTLAGMLDEVKLFNYALSDAEIQEINGTTDVENPDEMVPNQFILAQNYPNPFNPSTKIEFSCPKKSRVKLEIFDETGRKVATLVDEIREAGNYSVNFNSSNLSTGIYVYKLTTVNNMLARKMLYVK